MAAYPSLSVVDLSNFTGRPEAGYPVPYTDSALMQAVLLFRLATGLQDWPDEPDKQQLATYAILQMADGFILAQPHQEVMAQPFQSETIGSYSYTRQLKQLQAGLPTGVFWFDLAVQRLGISDDVASVTSGSLELFERDMLVVTYDGHTRVLGPGDLNRWDDAAGWSVSRPIPYDPNR